jgi:hypothetical protein
MTQIARAAERVSADRIHTAVPKNGDRRASRVGLDDDLAWFLECGGAAMGERGTLGGIVSALEHGGHAGGVPRTDLYDDRQLGWGRNVVGEVERHRWLLTAWNALTPETQGVLLARYMPPMARFRSDEGYGAREKWAKDSHPAGPKPIQPLGKRGKPIREKQYQARLARWERVCARISRQAKRTGVEARLGEWASLALILCSHPEKLLAACSDPNKGNREIRAEALKVARAASEAAHAEWAESKAGADPMRTRFERAAVAR